MEQLEFFNVPSPCVGVCTVDDKGYCKGCLYPLARAVLYLLQTVVHGLLAIWQMAVANRVPDVAGFT